MLADTSDLVILIPLTITSLTGSIITIIAALKTKEIQKQVTTINGRTLAQLGDAIETRRIEALPKDEITDADIEHLNQAPDPDAPLPDE